MKTIMTITLAAALTAGTSRTFAQNDALTALMQRRALEAQQLGGQPAGTTATPDSTTPADATTPTPTMLDQPQEIIASTNLPPIVNGSSTNGINLNFRNAPLETVLKYLSDSAGFIIQMQTRVSGTVNVMGRNLTKDEAVSVLNSELNRNNMGAMRNDRILTIMDKNTLLHSIIPVKTWDGKVESIPNDSEVVTYILPIRFVEAAQLARDLSSFILSQPTVVANEAANSIIITDTQANIRHLCEIIKAIDSSAEGETVVKVFPLKYANPSDVATLLGGIFPSDSGNPISVRGGGRGGGGGGGGGNPFAAMFGGGGNNTANSSQNRIKKQTQVIAVAESRTQSVVVTASRDLMDQITTIIESLDISSQKDQIVQTRQIRNIDPYQLLQVLQSTFPASTTSRSGSSTASSSGSALSKRADANSTAQGNSSATTLGNSSTGSRSGGSRSGGLP